ncbi:DegT/DnrJ/EryC1/StrS aminotransferase [Candidatus Magnetobacterium bavaricum]|uniref:DegT/DnrJ/EryC1/StrS aminotransferase n=1 Tax=Candidatus Magnetobacterium bavaricum TaxID=29290 RepID=A0A0F3GKW7_9BACT|nr:DegT/DnrJ/EryC1/StrS aminotransferase [Candidatus Magnetobacterium bavaricum]
MFIPGEPGLSPLIMFTPKRKDINIMRCALFSHARGAILYYLNTISVVNSKRQVLFPDYICCDLTEAVRAGGYEINYYKINPDLTPNTSSLMDSVVDSTLAVLFVHYFGFLAPVSSLIDKCAQKGIYVINDFAHMVFYEELLSSSIVLNGNVSIFSLRKTFSIADGALLFTTKYSEEMTSNDQSIRHKTEYLQYLKKIIKYLLGHTRFSPTITYGEELFYDNSFSEIKKISRLSELLFDLYIDTEKVKASRRNNFLYYVGKIKDSCQVNGEIETVYDQLNDFDVPYMFPIRLRRQNRKAIDGLRKQGIPAISWPTLPNEVKHVNTHAIAIKLQETLIMLPLHQDMDKKRIEFVINKLCALF